MPKIDAIVMPDGTEFEYDGDVFVAEYGVTMFSEIVSAYNEGKMLFCKKDRILYTFVTLEDGTDPYFVRPSNDSIRWVTVDGLDVWRNGTNGYHAFPSNSSSPTSSYYLAMSTTSGSFVRSTINFGSSTTKYLANNGTWQNLPTNVSSFNNDSGYLTLATLPIYNGGVS